MCSSSAKKVEKRGGCVNEKSGQTPNFFWACYFFSNFLCYNDSSVSKKQVLNLLFVTGNKGIIHNGDDKKNKDEKG